MKKIFWILPFFALFFCFLLTDHFNAKASDNYGSVCNKNIIARDRVYKNCGNGYIHTLPYEKSRSSGFSSTQKAEGDDSRTLFVGEIGGIDTFYTQGFYYYSVVYDDTSISNHNNNYWTTISRDGWIVHDKSFDDIIAVDQSKRFNVLFFNLEGEYLIKQYIGSNVANMLRVYVVGKNDLDLWVDSAKYGNKDIKSLNSDTFRHIKRNG